MLANEVVMVVSSQLKEQFRKEQLLLLQNPTLLSQDLISMWQAIQLLMQQKPGLWGLFYPLKSEPNLLQFLGLKLEGFAFPKCEANGLDFYTDVTHFKKGDRGVTEPITGRKVLPDDMAGILVPAISYGETGYRLGRGGGFYDRYLANFIGLKVGVCFEFQVLPEVPLESWDQRVNFIITNQRVREIK